MTRPHLAPVGALCLTWGGPPPTMVAFGAQTYRLATRLIPAGWYTSLVKVTHYSAWQFTREECRARVLAELGWVGGSDRGNAPGPR